MHNLDVNIRPGPDSNPVTTGTNEPAAPACCHPTPVKVCGHIHSQNVILMLYHRLQHCSNIETSSCISLLHRLHGIQKLCLMWDQCQQRFNVYG